MTNIKYPIFISSSLRIENLGEICIEPYYHLEHNIFPIGYKAVRIYGSMRHPNQKCEY